MARWSSFVVAGLWACGGAATPTAAAPTGDAPAPAAAEPPVVKASGPPAAIDCGDFTTCAIVKGGEVLCWGRDKMGELGDGGGGDRPRHVAGPGITNAVKLAMGSQFGCALLDDKTVKCWGTGRIANDGKAVTNARPVAVASLSGVEELVASGVIACARAGKTVTCWGADAASIGTPPKTAFVQITTGFTHGCGLDAKGGVACWGAGDWAPGSPLAKPNVTGAKQVVTGDRHACVVTKDKKVMCWGHNDAGQLGTKPDGDTHKTPVVVAGVTSVAKLVTGEASTCALLEDGSARCWGQNSQGELGLGTKSSDERPGKLAADGVADVCIASAHGCALGRSGTITCWGANAHGQLGDGSKESHLTPVAVAW